MGFPFPPKFEELYPQDAKLLSSRELSDLNTKILFDILIRKTVAAKMGYRLKPAGNSFMGQHLTSLSSSFSSSSPSFQLRIQETYQPEQHHQLSHEDYCCLRLICLPIQQTCWRPNHFSWFDSVTQPKPQRDLRNEFINDFNKIYDQRYKHNTNNKPSFEKICLLVQYIN